jgi:hypothetical protein
MTDFDKTLDLLDDMATTEDMLVRCEHKAISAALEFKKACERLEKAFESFRIARKLRDDTEAEFVKYSSRLEVITEMLKQKK